LTLFAIESEILFQAYESWTEQQSRQRWQKLQ